MTRATVAGVAVVLAVVLAGCSPRERGPAASPTSPVPAATSTAAGPAAAGDRTPVPSPPASPAPGQTVDAAALDGLEQALAELDRTLDQLDAHLAGDRAVRP